MSLGSVSQQVTSAPSSFLELNGQRIPLGINSQQIDRCLTESQDFELESLTNLSEENNGVGNVLDSVIIQSQEVERIVLNDTEMTDRSVVSSSRHDGRDEGDRMADNTTPLHFPQTEVKDERQNMSAEDNGQGRCTYSFVQEFGGFQDDMDFGDVRMLFKEMDVVENSYLSQQMDATMDGRGSEADKATKTDQLQRSRSQTEPQKLPHVLDKVPATCPQKPWGIGKPSNSAKQPGELLSPILPLQGSQVIGLVSNRNSKENSLAEKKQESVNAAMIAGSSTSAAAEPPGQESTADVTLLPSSVTRLHQLIREHYSDFAFVYALSAQLCQERVAMDCFVSLKMGLLLSLASLGTNPDCPPIAILALGNDSYMANYLMTAIGQLGERFVGPTDDAKPPSSAGYRNHQWIEADPILLAKGGVFYAGDWSRLKAARSDKLYKVIECSRVAIEGTKYAYPLETAIWAHWRSHKYNSKDQQAFNKFIKIFGIPIFMGEENHELLVNCILEQASLRLYESTIDHLSISPEDMRAYIAVISKRTVDTTSEASQLLQNYFVASRIERPDCLTKQAFVVLKQFSESFAKLSLRHEVLPSDVVGAVFMCEQSMQNIFGTNANPPPPFESKNFVGEVDEYMGRFAQWLRAYIDKYLGEEADNKKEH